MRPCNSLSALITAPREHHLILRSPNRPFRHPAAVGHLYISPQFPSHSSLRTFPMAPALTCMVSSSAVVGAQLQWTPRRLQAAAARQRRQRPLMTMAAVADRGSSGGAVLDRPGLDRTGLSSGPQTDSSGSQLGTSGGRGTGGGAWRILLLDSEHHTEERVVQAILAVVPGVEEPHAANCFHTVRAAAGSACCCAFATKLPPLPMSSHASSQCSHSAWQQQPGPELDSGLCKPP